MTRLDDIAARRAAATPGPWKATRTGRWEHDNYVTREDRLGVAMQYALVWQPGDAEFIAHAPEDIDALLAFVQDVRTFLSLREDGETPDYRILDNIQATLDRLEKP